MSDDTSAPARAEPIAQGERAPDFTLPATDSDGNLEDVHLAELLEQGPVVLLFYQDDGMPICTSELAAFAQEHELLAGAGYQVFGINTNGNGSHAKFQERDHFPFPLISDFHGDTVKAYGLWDAEEGKSRRAVVAIDPDGTVRYALAHFNPDNVAGFEDVFRGLGLV